MKLSLKITVFASIISIVFMLLIFGNVQRQLIDTNERYIVNQYENDLKQLKSSFDLILKKFTDVILFAGVMRKDAFYKNPAVLKKRFDTSIKNVPQVNKIKFISIKGEELVVSSRERLFEKPDKTLSYMDSDIFKGAFNQNVYYSDIYFKEKTNEMMINISKKVQDLKTLEDIGVIVVEISLGDIQEAISSKLANKNGIALLNLKNNKFLYKSSKTDEIDLPTLISINTPVAKLEQNSKSYLMVSDSYKFDGLDMRLYILNDTDNLFSDINKTFKENIFFLIVTILLLALVMYFFINYLFKPLKTLIKDIHRLSNEIDDGEKVIEEKKLDEVSSIRENFDLFVKLILKERGKLQEYNKNLEVKVNQEVEKNLQKEQLLAQQTKMASMGEMLGNIAHQWRQPLSIITTSASGLEVKSDFHEIKKEDIREFTKIIVNQAEYLSKTIDDFRNFIKGDLKYSDLSLKEVVQSSISLVKASLDDNHIVLVSQIDDDMDIYGNKNELSQALINIVNNAKDSLKSLNETKERLLFISTKKLDENSIELKILDSGGGIPPNVINRIFEPYFTTKHQSVGTGIGLSMVDKIIRKRHKGTIEVSNEEFQYKGKSLEGACFKIRFSKEKENKKRD